MLNEKRDIFISLNSVDKAWGDWIYYHLTRKHYSVYYQFADFPPGSDFMQLMNEALANTKITVAVWTDHYFDSKFASLEGRVALKQSIAKDELAYIPVKVEECKVDPLFSTRVYINLAGQKQFQAQKLLIGGIQAVMNKLEGKTKTTNISATPHFPAYIKNEALKTETTRRSGFSLQKPLKILYAGSKKSSDLDLESSYNTLSRSLKKYISTGTVKFGKNLNINTSNIFDVLIRNKPSIFHFSGKQDGGDIRITDEHNNITTISDIELAGYLTSFGDTIKLVILDTCYSYDCAKSIADVVDFAIGVKDLIYDVDADRFYAVFYNALCAGYSLKDAAGQATAALKFKKVPVKQIPVLLSRPTADPAQAYFV